MIDLLLRSFFCIIFFATGFLAIFVGTKRLKVLFHVIFFSTLLFFGVKGGIHWPFFGWHLYAIEIDENLEFYEFRMADIDNNEIKYDARALPPIITTPLRRLATKVADLPRNNIEELGALMFRNANIYREKINNSQFSLLSYLKFPPHQFGFKWTVVNLSGLGPFKKLRIYKVKMRLDEKSLNVIERSDQCVVDLQY